MKINDTIQHTLNRSVSFCGKGVHSNKDAHIILSPAPANTGIVFVRCDEDGQKHELKAHYQSVGATELCTIIGDVNGIFVATIEHLMSTLISLGLDNVYIEAGASEVPVMDGSAYDFVQSILDVGVMPQTARRRYLRVEKTIRVEMGRSFGELTPYDGTFFDVEIDYDHQAIGRQRFAAEMTPGVFIDDVCRARTFGFMSDVDKLREAGFALGSSFDNTVVVGDDGILNPSGLRFPDEFVRHKLLDAIGDLSLCGGPILGAFRSYRGGHKLNFMMLEALFADHDAWSWVEAGSCRVPPRLNDEKGNGTEVAPTSVSL